MVEGYARTLKQVLQEAGCFLVRQGKGDHQVWSSPMNGKRFPIDSKILSRHSANEILKMAGLPKRF
jgi:hypothetical protein